MRLRAGAEPFFLVTVNPIPGLSSGTGAVCKVKPRRLTRLPRAALKNCARRVSRRKGTSEPATAAARKPRSGRQFLAAACAAGIQNLAAVLGGHAGTETMTAGTHQAARLESTLHCIKPRPRTVPLFIFCARLPPQRHGTGTARSLRQSWAAYRKNPPPSQRRRALITPSHMAVKSQRLFRPSALHKTGRKKGTIPA